MAKTYTVQGFNPLGEFIGEVSFTQGPKANMTRRKAKRSLNKEGATKFKIIKPQLPTDYWATTAGRVD